MIAWESASYLSMDMFGWWRFGWVSFGRSIISNRLLRFPWVAKACLSEAGNRSNQRSNPFRESELLLAPPERGCCFYLSVTGRWSVDCAWLLLGFFLGFCRSGGNVPWEVWGPCLFWVRQLYSSFCGVSSFAWLLQHR